MKKKLIALVLVLSFASLAHADDATKRVSAQKLIDVMHVDTMMDQMFEALKAQIPAMIQSGVGQEDLNPAQQKIVAEFQSKMFDIVRDEIKTQVEPKMVDVYMKSFSEEEIDGMLTFYSSPVGQSVLQKMPQVMQNSMASMQGVTTDMMPKIKALADEYTPKIKAAATPPAS